MSVQKSDIYNNINSDAMVREDSKSRQIVPSSPSSSSFSWSSGSDRYRCDDNSVVGNQDLVDVDGSICPTEAQCRCHMSYSCDYRTVDVRWKCTSARNNNNNMRNSNNNNHHHRYHCCPTNNCFHWERQNCYSCCHETSSSPPPLLATSYTSVYQRSPSSSSSSSTSSSSVFSSHSSTSSFLSTTVDRVGVADTCGESARDPCPKCDSNNNNHHHVNNFEYNNNDMSNSKDQDFLSYFCDVIYRRRGKTKDSRQCLKTQDLSMITVMLQWKWDFTSKVHRFMTRFSGRRRRSRRRRALNSLAGYQWARMTSFLYVIFVVMAGCLHFHVADACSSRSTPKPRPPSPTLRPNITIQTYTCPPEYAAHYCLNGATCFTVKIGESILYNCECAEGYMGQRCEFKDLDGSYLPSKQRAMLEQAGITSGVAIMVVFVIIVCFYLYVRSRRKSDPRRSSGHDEVDTFVHQARRPFSGLHSSATIQHHSPTTMLPPSTFPNSGKILSGMTCESLPNSPTKAANNNPASAVAAAEIQPTQTNNSNPVVVDTKSAVLLKASIVPNNNQSRLCV